MVICPVFSGRMVEFAERFGIGEVRTALGSTETGAPIFGLVAEEPPETWVGRVREGVSARVVDDNDVPVPAGDAGQLVLRGDRPWEITSGYLDEPAESAAAWRNGWFHTGDLVRLDDDGNLFWVDRLKDCIRRRGENISSYGVEAQILKFAGVEEAACVAARNELDDEEVKAWVVAGQGAIDWSALVDYLAARLPYFMVPRYYDQAVSLPKTPTMRVEKFRLRGLGNSSSTWDREEAGLVMTRSGLERRTIVKEPS